MVQSMKATYKDGVLEPSESLDLEDGDVVMLSIWVEVSAEDGASAESASVDGNGEMDGVDNLSTVRKPAGLSILEMFDEIHASIPESAWDNVPTDGAINYKHYLYGWPKVETE